MSSSATIPAQLISAFKATAASVGTETDVEFDDLHAAFKVYGDQLRASVAAVATDIPEDDTDKTIYTDSLNEIEKDIQELEGDSEVDLTDRPVCWKTAATRKPKEDEFSHKVTTLEGYRVSLDQTTLLGRLTQQLAARLKPGN